MATTTIAEFMAQDHDRLDDMFKQFQAIKEQNASKARSLFQEFLTGQETTNDYAPNNNTPYSTLSPLCTVLFFITLSTINKGLFFT